MAENDGSPAAKRSRLAMQLPPGVQQRLKTSLNKLRFPSIIGRKRDGHELSDEEIEHFVLGAAQETIPREQLAALLMAIVWRGMSTAETVSLTSAMLASGSTLSFPKHTGIVVDKHSTGGVGDKVSLILAPALAAAGLRVPMMSGRGLGHSGGTLDKLEAIPGYSVEQTEEQIQTIIDTVGCGIFGQTETLVPADRILYGIRDVTGTVESVPLITGSIISKKAAEGISALVMDVKVGRGAFMKNMDEARTLARSLVDTGNGLGMKVVAMITPMDDPLGRMIGNALEVAEAVEMMQGKGFKRLEDLVCAEAGRLLVLTQKAATAEEGCEEIRRTLHDGRALAKFQAMVQAQGASAETAAQLCRNPWSVLQRAAETTELVHSGAAGVVQAINAMEVALVSLDLGAGRQRSGDKVNHAVGVEILCHVGEPVASGQAWLRVHHDTPLTDDHKSRLQAALTTGSEAPALPPTVLELVE